jgi:hypothetical protein
MTREEIIQGNYAIAKMLGWQYVTWQDTKNGTYDNSIKAGWWSTVPSTYHPKINRNLYRGRGANELKFHSDWNWLMEAVDYIEKLEVKHATYASDYDVLIDRFSCSIVTTGYNSQTILTVDNPNKKDCVYRAVVEFANKKIQGYV